MDTTALDRIRQDIEALLERPDALPEGRSDAVEVLGPFLDALASGALRAAWPDGAGGWRVDALVKRGILLGFRLGRWKLLDAALPFSFSDKHTYAPRRLPLEEHNVRLVPGGTSVRAGAYLGRDVTVMPPSYLNVGAHVGDGTLVDSHVLVGSCAQVGARCHLSAGVQLGGVLEPVGQLPVIIEDDVFIGGNSGVYEGTIVRAGAVLAAGTVLTRGTPVHDLVHERELRAEAGQPLEIPAGAVVVPGSRPARGAYAQARGVQLYAPVIVKYRDARTGASVTLEEALR